jgi:hypothetical protein
MSFTVNYKKKIWGKFFFAPEDRSRIRSWIQIRSQRYRSVFRIHDILVWIWFRIHGSMPLTNGSGSCYFRHWPSRGQQNTNLKKVFLLITFLRYRYLYIIFQRWFFKVFLKIHLHQSSKIKKVKRIHKIVVIKVFFTFACWWKDNDGSGWPKNIRILRIRIHTLD